MFCVTQEEYVLELERLQKKSTEPASSSSASPHRPAGGQSTSPSQASSQNSANNRSDDNNGDVSNGATLERELEQATSVVGGAPAIAHRPAAVGNGTVAIGSDEAAVKQQPMQQINTADVSEPKVSDTSVTASGEQIDDNDEVDNGDFEETTATIVTPKVSVENKCKFKDQRKR